MSARIDPDFWRGKRVLLTGHSGFKGAWMTLWLQRLGAKVVGISLAPATTPNLFDLAALPSVCESHFCDIRDRLAVAEIVQQARPDIVFHLAAQPLVRYGYREPIETFSTNVMGTSHVLEAMRGLDSVRVAVMITTDKVYRNNEWSWPYREADALGGHDPYSASKACSELVIDAYRSSYLEEQGVALASVRAGNVIGGGDWSEDRLIPDAVRAWQADETLQIRRPDSIRPWQHVLEPLAGYLTLAQGLWSDPVLAGAYNFGPLTHEATSVKGVVEIARAAYGRGKVEYAEVLNGPHEAGLLTLEVAKVREKLGIVPKMALKETVERTMHWYDEQSRGGDARTLCERDIAYYETLP